MATKSSRLTNFKGSPYFHRPPVPDIPRLGEIDVCQTIYAWPTLRERLRQPGTQLLEVTVGNQVRWDIDYVGLLYEVEPQPEYDFALSFAGEDREYVEQVARHLVRSGAKVFYDLYAQADLWGENLYEHLTDVYKEKARYAVLFHQVQLCNRA